MAAGQPYVASDGEAFLAQLLAADPLLRKYLPGEPAGEKPGEGTLVSCPRFWKQSSGTDKKRQDGELGRAVSFPTYVVVALDRQTTGLDKVFGTVGGKLTPRQPYLQLAQKRLYTILHGRRVVLGDFVYDLDCSTEYSIVEPTKSGAHDVQLGWWLRMTVQ